VSERGLDDRVREELAPDFRVVRVLGRGAMASVYLAREVAIDRMVAIKVLAPGHAGDTTAGKRFEREARSAARIRHENVTAVYQVGRLSDALPYLVMEYVDGRNLEDVLTGGGALPEAEGREALRQLASGLAAAHESEIIHRDLKPANVLRENGTGRIVLTDFGVAAVRDSAGTDTTRLTVQGQILTDIAYVAPEHLMGEELTEMADIYALGVLGYEILAGRGPYPGKSPGEIAAAHLRAEPTPLLALAPSLDPAVAEVVERCLAKKPDRRPRAAEVVAALEAEAPAGAIRKEPETALEAFLIELKRRRVYRVAVAYLAIGLAAIGGTSDINEALRFPDWVERGSVVLILTGFPITLVLAWMFDVRAGHLMRTVEDSESRRARVVAWVALAGALAVAGVLGWVLLF